MGANEEDESPTKPVIHLSANESERRRSRESKRDILARDLSLMEGRLSCEYQDDESASESARGKSYLFSDDTKVERKMFYTTDADPPNIQPIGG